ncbi:MAG: 2-C-methyl-D-erythritol 2,4-cyclodiphosphate synthase, partial [Desulfofundulus sp.]
MKPLEIFFVLMIFVFIYLAVPKAITLYNKKRKCAGGASRVRVGFGYDVHRLVAGRPLILGGVSVPFDRGL